MTMGALFSFENLVTDAFAEIIVKYCLALITVDVSEVMLKGDGFTLLVWLDRDGTSLKYLDLRDPQSPQVLDIIRYLATRRSWKPFLGGVPSTAREDRVRAELAAIAKNLEDSASDILRGETGWLEEITQQPQKLSATHVRCLLDAASKRENSENSGTGV